MLLNAGLLQEDPDLQFDKLSSAGCSLRRPHGTIVGVTVAAEEDLEEAEGGSSSRSSSLRANNTLGGSNDDAVLHAQTTEDATPSLEGLFAEVDSRVDTRVLFKGDLIYKSTVRWLIDTNYQHLLFYVSTWVLTC